MSDPVIIRSRRRKRTVALDIAPDGSVRVLAPAWTSLSWIHSFIASRAAWIARRRQERAKRSVSNLSLAEGAILPFHGQGLKLSIAPPEAMAKQEGDNLFLPLAPDLSPEAQKAELKTELLLWYKKQARQIIPPRVEAWARQMEVRPAKVLLSNPEKRWGSCSAKDDIRLSWRLILLSPAVLDYVIVHELAHIKHKNHGVRFWRFVGKFLPDFETRRRALRKGEKDLDHTGLFAPD